MTRLFTSVALIAILCTPAVLAQGTRAVSPDGAVEISLAIQGASETAASGPVVYQVSYRGRQVLMPSRLGLELQNQAPLGERMRIVSSKTGGADETYRMPHGKSNPVRNHYQSVAVELEESAGPARKLTVELRAYDDGVAFRYIVPRQGAIRELRLVREKTEFKIFREGTAYSLILDGFRTSYEDNYVALPLSGIKKSALIALPFLAEVPGIAWMAITEAFLENYPGMYLSRSSANALTLEAQLALRIDEPGLVAIRETPCASPWRVVMLGKTPGRLVESNLVINLNPPSALQDDSWIKPGKTAWNWWSGSVVKGVDFQPGMNTATMKYYIDFAAEAKLEYMLIDAGWSVAQSRNETDITRTIPAIDMPEIIRYAASMNVKVWLWAHWTAIDRQMDEAFPLYEKWGIAGVKIDFMDRDDQWMVEFYRRVARKAAEHHLMIDFHGAFKPTGMRRTYPNVMTHEGVMGLEYLKWSARVTPDHNVTLPFTRMLAGPMDYTPGGFNNVTAAEFEPRNREPMTLGTRAHQLALYVVFESALQMVSDHPGAYRGEKELDFISRVPAGWDETRVLAGQPMDYIVVARRKGAQWYVGCLTGSRERTIELPLDFLPAGEFRAEIYSDAPDAAQFPKKTDKEERSVGRDTRLTVRMAPGGGQAIRIFPPAQR
jgi:alpha-glucosidase